MSDLPQAKRLRTPPQVIIGDKPFIDLYPNWQQICDYFEWAIDQEVSSGSTPRAYLADQQRFLNFFTEHVLRSDLGIGPDQVADVVDHVFDEFFGVGLVAPWLEDPDVEDIILDSYKAMDVTRRGRKERVSPTPWVDDADVFRWMQRILARDGKQLSEYNPMENGRLPDGSRLIFLCQPVVKTCGFAIRKHRVERFQQEMYEGSGVAPAGFFEDLRGWVSSHQNILASGATGSGKTTLLNYAGSLIPEEERILVVEDTPELQIPHPRSYSMAAVVRGARGGRGEEAAITMQDLVRATLRMKPDRIIVGEVRGAEAFDLLNAMNTGHDGGMSTLHSNSPADAMLRLESLAAPANPNMPTWALQDLIGVTVGIVIQMKQLPGTSRRVVVEAAQVVHPAKLADRRQLEGCLELREGRIYVRTLWLWDNSQGELVRVASPLPLAGQYFGELG